MLDFDDLPLSIQIEKLEKLRYIVRLLLTQEVNRRKMESLHQTHGVGVPQKSGLHNRTCARADKFFY